jgi:hypothetical protein
MEVSLAANLRSCAYVMPQADNGPIERRMQYVLYTRKIKK